MDQRSSRATAVCCGLLAAVAFVCSCIGSGPTDSGTSNTGADTTNPQIAFTVLPPSPYFVAEGASIKLMVTLVRTNYAGAVPLSVLNLPAGVTGTFDPPTLTGATLTSTLTISAANTAPVGEYGFGITATGAGGNPTGLPFTLGVVQPRVSVSKSGSGSGTVISSPPGISCGGTCSAGFPPGSITLRAAPNAGSTFAGWGGACAGTTTTCTVATSSGQVNVVATFNFMAP